MAQPASIAGTLATSSSRTSIPMRSKLYGSSAKRAMMTTAPMARRLATPPPANGPCHSQHGGNQQQRDLGPPEAVLAGAGGLGVVLSDDHLPAQHANDRPVGSGNNPAEAIDQGQDYYRRRDDGENPIEPGVEQVLPNPAKNAHLRTGRRQAFAGTRLWNCRHRQPPVNRI